ncbi:MAG TPA: dihydrofolate reductase family protein, partial [Thermoleophilaceae bacterium]
ADMATEVSQQREQPGGDVLVNGSAQLVQALIERDLVDEYRLMVFPVLLGAGKRMFAEASDATGLRLVDTKPAGECVILTYAPAAKDGD